MALRNLVASIGSTSADYHQGAILSEAVILSLGITKAVVLQLDIRHDKAPSPNTTFTAAAAAVAACGLDTRAIPSSSACNEIRREAGSKIPGRLLEGKLAVLSEACRPQRQFCIHLSNEDVVQKDQC